MKRTRPTARLCHLVRRSVRGSTILCCLLALSGPVSAETPTAHPLDPLSKEEIARTVAVLAASGRTDATTRATAITLKEADKNAVLAWKAGQASNRKALAILRSSGKTIEAVIDTERDSLESWEVIPGVQPAITSEEWVEAQRLVKADPDWQAAMGRRGYESFDEIFCDSLSAGRFAAEERRLIRMPCYDTAGSRSNVYAKPIEGLIVTVDLDAKAVVAISDSGPVAANRDPQEFGEADINDLRPTMKPVRSRAPQGWNFELEGRMLRWQGWSMHLGFDQRFGPVLSLIGHEESGQERSLLYQAHVSEVFVPYMDPDPNWAFRTYMDVGEYGLGTLASRLVPGIDCPREAAFLDAALAAPKGHVFEKERVLCVFERDPATPLWRHAEALNGVTEGRPATELVVRSIPSIAHYDYIIDWVFSLSGQIEVKIGATGIDAVKGVSLRHLSDDGAEDVLGTGSLVAPGLMAVNHDHFFSLRLDFDIDGPTNRFVRERITPEVLPEGSARRSLWRLVEDPLRQEAGISAGGHPQLWRIENPASLNDLGSARSYQIQGHGPRSLLVEEDWPQRRAAFSRHHLWITVRHDDERFAAGPYPNQSRGGEGLPRYSNGERIEEADIVAWYTLGFRHVTRPEDWPILSTVWQSVKLRPFGFFGRNPSLTVRRRFLDEAS